MTIGEYLGQVRLRIEHNNEIIPPSEFKEYLNMKSKENKLKSMEQKCYKIESELDAALSKLSIMASEILGYEVCADLCHGGEIEFRRVDDFDVVDSFDCIRMENVIDKLK